MNHAKAPAAHPENMDAPRVPEGSGTPHHNRSKSRYNTIDDIIRKRSALIDDLSTPLCSESAYADSGESPLQTSARRGNKDEVKAQLENGADPNAKNKKGETPLHTVCIESTNPHKQVMQLLIEKNANVNAKTDVGYTPLMSACTEAEFTSRMDIRDRRLVVKALIKSGADVNAMNDHGETAIDIAKQYDHHGLAYFLTQVRDTSPA